jgi:NUMOD1 domain
VKDDLISETDTSISDKKSTTRKRKFSKRAKSILVTNIDKNTSVEYSSITEASLNLKLTRNTVRSYIKTNKIFIVLRNDKNKNLIKERYLLTLKLS